MDEQFAALIAGDLPPGIDSLALGAVHGSRPLATGTSYRPAPFVRNDVLIALGHFNLLI
jgi:hypothetical protein